MARPVARHPLQEVDREGLVVAAAGGAGGASGVVVGTDAIAQVGQAFGELPLLKGPQGHRQAGTSSAMAPSLGAAWVMG